jgi:hypothetical protein
MKYKDLIQFDPIETIIQLRDANKTDVAHNLVHTYVVSKQMAERISDIAIPNLQYDEPRDNKGILVVGNYGTGKSHLLSIISSIAEDASYLDDLHHDELRGKARPIAGRFQVCRLEIGATTMNLHDIVCNAISDHFEKIGISFKFPQMSAASNNKSAFEDMMAAFERVYPDKGYLLVVDELLDYLRTRKDHDLILDLNFLREIGEVCKNLRFRFIAGVQEAIFESPRFSFAADSLHRVKDRFEQVIIARNDVKFVVAERLLKKNAEQQHLVREHLQKFSRFFSSLSERMEEFVSLFPIHPDYIDTFERIKIAEKREVLKTLSLGIREFLEQDVPEDQPGIIAFDAYWENICEDASFRGMPDVRQVIDISKRIEDRILLGSINQLYKESALRIIHALSVERLTTGDIYAPVGSTPEELRDRLCLYDKNAAELGGKEPDKDLLTHIETVLREIIKAVNGQFISYSPENRQYYLDLKKTEDFDENIRIRAESLDNDTLDRYYYQVLRIAMECQDIETWVPHYLIWQHELEWRGRNVTRLGYLFFGAPNERSTAVPPRDFYLYFLQPYDPPSFRDEKKPDEVFFRLKSPDEFFIENLKLFAGANELALTSSAQQKQIYTGKAETFRKNLHEWLTKNIDTAFEVTYRGQSKPMSQWMKGKSIRDLAGIGVDQTINFRDYVNSIASLCLSPYFEDQAPNYPHFSIKITTKNRAQAAQEALRAIAQNPKQSFTRQARAVLEGLMLIDNDRIDPSKSPYANYILDKFANKSPGQVINRNEIIERVHDVDFMDPSQSRLEPEWVAVILASLVYSGQIVLVVGSQKFDATNLQVLAATSLDELTEFKHIEPPKEWNKPGLQALFELLQIAPGNVNLIIEGKEEPVRQMQDQLLQLTTRLAQAKKIVDEGLEFWGVNLIEKEEFKPLKEGIKATQEFLDSLQGFTSPGKLKNFRSTVEEVKRHEPVLVALKKLETLKNLINDQYTFTNYLSQAAEILPTDNPWRKKYEKEKEEILNLYRTLPINELNGSSRELSMRLHKLKNEYKKAYIELHSQNRLGRSEDEKKRNLTSDRRFYILQKLTSIELLQNNQFVAWRENLAKLKTCFSLSPEQLDKIPYCQDCEFRPVAEPEIHPSAKRQLIELDGKLDEILEAVTHTLITNLSDPIIQQNLELLKPDEHAMINNVVMTREIPEVVDSNFVNALQHALSGLVRIPLRISDLTTALKLTEGPTTVDELHQRFEDFLEELTKGKDPNKVRIVME